MKTPPDRLPHVRRFLAEHPWAITPAAFAAICEIVERRVAGIELTAEEISERIGAARRLPSAPAASGAIAVLPIHGVLAPRVNMLSDISGGTSYEQLGRAFDALVADPNVSAIVLDVDSPGGSVLGLEELAAKIFGARGTKPIVAVANHEAGSAAYYLASQAGELVVSPSGMVGSIGTIALHDDLSAAAEKAGVKRTYVTAGRFKAEGNPMEPLGDEARAELQRKVDAYFGEFVRAVASGRGTSQANVRDNFGQGRMVMAADAVRLGMADREGTLEETLLRLAGRRAPSGTRAELEAPAITAEDTNERVTGDGSGEALPPIDETTDSVPEAHATERERLRLQLERARLSRRA